MYTCSYSSNPIYLPFDASPSEHVNIFYFTVNYRDFANYRFRKLQISQTADFANYRFRKLQISQITDFANCRFRKLQISFRFVSFRFVNYSKPLKFSRYFKLVRPFLKLRAPWALALIVAPHAVTLAKV